MLDGATVMYGSASELRATLEYDFSQEKDFSYRGLSMDEIIHHLAVFISRLWQIHIFGEGNTRTTAVFFIKYLRTLGFSATNDIFADHAWYFRNALVRANYTNLQKNIHETTVHIHRLFEKFGFDEVFGRSAVMELLQLKSSGASKLISNLVQSDIIEPVSGHGKGKYKFRVTIQYPVKYILIFRQNRENKISVSSSF